MCVNYNIIINNNDDDMLCSSTNSIAPKDLRSPGKFNAPTQFIFLLQCVTHLYRQYINAQQMCTWIDAMLAYLLQFSVDPLTNKFYQPDETIFYTFYIIHRVIESLMACT